MGAAGDAAILEYKKGEVRALQVNEFSQGGDFYIKHSGPVRRESKRAIRLT